MVLLDKVGLGQDFVFEVPELTDAVRYACRVLAEVRTVGRFRGPRGRPGGSHRGHRAERCGSRQARRTLPVGPLKASARPCR